MTPSEGEGEEEEEGGSQACCSAGLPCDTANANANANVSINVVVDAGSPEPEESEPVAHPSGYCRSPRIRGPAGAGGHLLARGKKDTREDRSEGGDPQEDGEVCRKEAMKTLCNVIYNSPEAQDRASALR